LRSKRLLSGALGKGEALFTAVLAEKKAKEAERKRKIAEKKAKTAEKKKQKIEKQRKAEAKKFN
jgi:colicin import membrane protein